MALDQLNFKVIKKIDPLIQKDVLKILKIENSINSKNLTVELHYKMLLKC